MKNDVLPGAFREASAGGNPGRLDSRADADSLSAEGTGQFSGCAAAGQNALLASIETRLTDEVIWLIDTLGQFGRRTQAIGEEVPDSADFTKFVTRLLSLMGFQLANALSLGINERILFDDGAQYLGKLGLRLEDAFREISLDGRKFLCVADINGTVDESHRAFQDADSGIGRSNDVHSEVSPENPILPQAENGKGSP